MTELPTVAPSCPLTPPELKQQLGRYKTVGSSAEVLVWNKRRRVLRVGAAVPDVLVERLVEAERACCPFFGLSWYPRSRRLAISVADRGHEPALDAIGYALGVPGPGP